MDTTKKPATTGIITPSMLWREFVADFLDRFHCRRWIIDRLHPSGPRCPQGDALPGRQIERYYEGKRVKCPTCGRFFTAFSGTFLSGTAMDAHQFAALLLLYRLNVPNSDIARIAGLSQEAVRLWRRKLRLLEVITGMTAGDTEKLPAAGRMANRPAPREIGRRAMCFIKAQGIDPAVFDRRGVCNEAAQNPKEPIGKNAETRSPRYER